MTNTNAPMWGIHAGATGDADTLFLHKQHLAIGWTAMGDLAQLPNDVNAFKQALSQAYPNSKPGAIPVNAGQLYRFIHVMQIGDVVVYPSKQDKLIHIGEVTGAYSYDVTDVSYPNQRSVTWLKHSPRSSFLPAALLEAGAAMSLFKIQNHANRFRAILSGQPTTVAAATAGPTSSGNDSSGIDPTPPLIAANIEEITKDFILGRLSQHLKGHPFATFVAHLFDTMGYRTRVSSPGADGGVDIVAHKDEFELLPPIIKVQVKSTSGSVGGPEVAYLNGILGQAEYGILVTLGTFTNQAANSANGMSKIKLINGAALTSIVLQYYDLLDPKYKSIMPLKKIFAPDDTDYQSN